MLCISRKPGQAIVLDGVIRVVVNKVHGDRVYLAIDAPLEVKVLRDELWRRDEKDVARPDAE